MAGEASKTELIDSRNSEFSEDELEYLCQERCASVLVVTDFEQAKNLKFSPNSSGDENLFLLVPSFDLI